MSILQAAYSEVLAGFRNWQKIGKQARFSCLQSAYSLIGKPFLQALSEMQRSPEQVVIYENSVFVTMTIRKKKFILFHSNTNPLTNLDCNCEVSWRRKVKGDTCLVCMHQIIYQFSKYMFKNQAKYSQQASQLKELLYKNK